MLSAVQARATIRPIIVEFDKKIEASQTVSDIEDKSKSMMQEIVDVIKPDYRVELIHNSVMP